MRKSLALIAVALLASVALSACSGIPRAGSVQEGVAAGVAGNNDVQFLPSGPADGASPEDILRGFVDAATSPADDWGIARKFLSADYRTKWQPSQRVIVDRGNRIVTSAAAGNYSLGVTQVAQVDEWGLYAAEADRDTKLEFALARENGQWRIASAPEGIILDSGLFPQVFAETQLFFYDANFQRLVPDNRWFPARSSTTTRVVKSLLQGPAKWLAQSGGVVSAFTPGALLVADSVPVEGSTAVVNFDVKSLAANDVTLQRMLTQIGASLSSVPNVTRVRMVLSGARQLEAEVPAIASVLGNSFLAQPTVLADRTFGGMSAASNTTPQALSDRIASLRPSQISMSGARNEVALLDGGQAAIVNMTGAVRIIDKRPALAQPVIDTYGYVWSVPQLEPLAMTITSATSDTVALRVPWDHATKIEAVAVSPEGSRIVATYRTQVKNEACVASILRNAANAPTAVGPCLLVALDSGDLGSAGWVDASRVGVVLASGSTSTIQTIRLGGLSSRSQVNARVRAITGAGPALLARILTEDGDVLQQVSSPRWYLVTTGVDALADVQ